MPKAFGSFRNAPTLDCVCDDCNQFFGRELELPLARGSGEGLLRYVFGQRRGEDFLDFRSDAVQVTLEEGLWQGLHVRIVYDREAGELRIAPQGPQVGFKRRGADGYEFFLMDELDDSVWHRSDIDIEARPVFFLRDTDREEMLRQLEAIGIRKRYEEDVPGPGEGGEEVAVEISSQINSRLRRSVAKIAFNYLVWLHGSDFALAPMFDQVRSFIREGITPEFRPVLASTAPILADDTRSERQTNGHLVKINFDSTGLALAGWVSLFNYLTYAVILARPFTGIYRPDIRRGHLFDWESGEIQELTAISAAIILPPSLRSEQTG